MKGKSTGMRRERAGARGYHSYACLPPPASRYSTPQAGAARSGRTCIPPLRVRLPIEGETERDGRERYAANPGTRLMKLMRQSMFMGRSGRFITIVLKLTCQPYARTFGLLAGTQRNTVRVLLMPTDNRKRYGSPPYMDGYPAALPQGPS